MGLDCCTVVWLVLIAGVRSHGAQSQAAKYETSLDDSNSSYSIKIQTPVQTICSQECLQRSCVSFSYDKQSKECLLDTGIGEGLFNRSSGSLAFSRHVKPCLSRGKEVTHSTVRVDSTGRDFSGSKVVDGYYTPEQSGLETYESMMVLARQQDPWFEIDLEDDLNIEGMKFWRRPGRDVQDLKLTVAKDGQPGNYALCAIHDGLLDFVEKVECTSLINGRYIKVVQQTYDWFQLYEVEVFGP